MSNKLLIQNARLIDPNSSGLDSGTGETTDIAIKQNRIHAIGNAIAPDEFSKATIIDAKSHWLIPGLIDLGVYLREPGQENKTRINNETIAAASGGITRLCAMPEVESPIDSGATVRLIKSKAKDAKASKVSVIGALTENLGGEKLSHMGSLKYVGCAGISQGRMPIKDLATLRKAMEYASTYELPFFLHPIEHSLSPKGGMHEGALSTRLGLPGIPVAAETVAINQILALAAQTRTSVHFCRISSAEGVALIRQAKEDGLPVTADVAIHHLFLTEMDVSEYNPLCHVEPPLRSERDKTTLRSAVREGVIDVICSDHQPHEVDAKLAPFEETSPGISGVETLLPLTLKLVDENVLTLQQAIQAISTNPANILNLNEGSLTKGNKADCVIIDPEAHWELDINTLLSEGKNTPFHGWDFKGKVTHTIIRGKVIYSAQS